MIALPPSAGSCHDTTAPEFSGLAFTDGDAPGTVRGVAGSDVSGSLLPAALVATTEKVYAVPLTRPPTVHDNGLVSVETVVQVAPPVLAVTV